MSTQLPRKSCGPVSPTSPLCCRRPSVGADHFGAAMATACAEGMFLICALRMSSFISWALTGRRRLAAWDCAPRISSPRLASVLLVCTGRAAAAAAAAAGSGAGSPAAALPRCALLPVWFPGDFALVQSCLLGDRGVIPSGIVQQARARFEPELAGGPPVCSKPRWPCTPACSQYPCAEGHALCIPPPPQTPTARHCAMTGG
mmetsp:Transcript_87436/g.270726  ORF Transcript_87436/g.270726 Transcript_87436/m.270726 type:complete len:202 (-) Transcript_87436:46-651(-)